MSDSRYKPPAQEEKISSHASLDLAIKRWQLIGGIFESFIHLGTFIGPIILIIYFGSSGFSDFINRFSLLFIALALFLVGFGIYGSYRLGQLKLQKRRAKPNPEDDWQIPT